MIPIDGNKFKAVNRRRKIVNTLKLKQAIENLDEDIDRYLDEMDEADKEAPEKKEFLIGIKDIS